MASQASGFLGMKGHVPGFCQPPLPLSLNCLTWVAGRRYTFWALNALCDCYTWITCLLPTK